MTLKSRKSLNRILRNVGKVKSKTDKLCIGTNAIIEMMRDERLIDGWLKEESKEVGL